MPLFALTILLSAFLLFLVQPILAKQILPWFGGSAAVWTVCMVFFQTLLLAGYAYAHALSRWLAPRRQAAVHVALLAASLAALPIVPDPALRPQPGDDAALRILQLLAVTIGLPYLLLSSTGPLLQRWVAHRFAERSVYRLFALSNLGSLLGLLAFPFAIEPRIAARTQSMLWSAAYAVFVLACAAEALQAARRGKAGPAMARSDSAAPGPAHDEAAAAPRRPRAGEILSWIGLAALGSVLLLSATSHVSQNVATVPFLWVLPLSLYLATFILAFEGRGGRGFYEPGWGIPAALLFAVLMAASLSAQHGVLDIGLAIPLACAGVFFGCLFCHGELAHGRPAPRHLTLFYLCVSIGGALGGVAVGLLAPRLLPMTVELPLALFALCAVAVARTLRARAKLLAFAALLACIGCAAGGIQYVRFLRHDTIAMRRDFYGTLRVRQQGSGATAVRRLLHGVILHGEQPLEGPLRAEPGTYYARSSGVGRAILSRQSRSPGISIGVVGLGIGTLSAYGRPADRVRFYEINPDVVPLAHRYFGYLDESRAPVDITLGDARLSLDRELAAAQPPRYDVLAVDAFSSDSIPVHLITREAVALYLRALAPHGILAVHISNRFLDLQPVLAGVAGALDVPALLVEDRPGPESDAANTEWVLIARDPAALDDPALASVARPLVASQQHPILWTDDFNDLLQVLRIRPIDELRELVDDSWEALRVRYFAPPAAPATPAAPITSDP